jgi:hypothetical protein
MALSDWPDDWPANCPPPDAGALPLTAYRVTDNDPPTAADFQTWFEKGKEKPGKECECRGVSVFFDVRDAKHHRSLFRGGFIAEGDLPDDSGKAKNTESRRFPSHVTWWVKKGLSREHFFKRIDV